MRFLTFVKARIKHAEKRKAEASKDFDRDDLHRNAYISKVYDVAYHEGSCSAYERVLDKINDSEMLVLSKSELLEIYNQGVIDYAKSPTCLTDFVAKESNEHFNELFDKFQINNTKIKQPYDTK